jgi:acetaldehyde dehydrogenase
MIKIKRMSTTLDLVAMVGVDPESDGLKRARRLGVTTTHEGLEGLRRLDVYREIEIFFDATSAGAHKAHAKVLAEDGKTAIDMTPAAIGPYVVPAVNLKLQSSARNFNMVTCGGQATIPIVAAINSVSPVHYAEIVASIASKSAGPGTRANIDEFTETTSRAIESVGGAKRGKAIIVLNPAEPPLMMRDTVLCLVADDADRDAIVGAVKKMVAAVQAYVPGYRLKQDVQFEHIGGNDRSRMPAGDLQSCLKVSVFLEVEGAAHYLPSYAGNLDIMTSAALATAERLAAN